MIGVAWNIANKGAVQPIASTVLRSANSGSDEPACSNRVQKTVEKTEDKADETADQAKSTDAGAGVQASSSTTVNAGGNSANVNSSTNSDANASGNGAAVNESSKTGAAVNSTEPEKKSGSSDAKQTTEKSKGHGQK